MSAREHPPQIGDEMTTLAHLRLLAANAGLPWTYWSEWFHPLQSGEGCCDHAPNEYRAPAWGGDDVLVTTGQGSCEDLDDHAMAFAAASSRVMPLLLDLYEAVLNGQSQTTNASDPVQCVLAALEEPFGAPEAQKETPDAR